MIWSLQTEASLISAYHIKKYFPFGAEWLPERAERIIPFQAELVSRWSGIRNYGNYLYDCKYEDSTWTCSYGKQKDTS